MKNIINIILLDEVLHDSIEEINHLAINFQLMVSK